MRSLTLLYALLLTTPALAQRSTLEDPTVARVREELALRQRSRRGC